MAAYNLRLFVLLSIYTLVKCKGVSLGLALEGHWPCPEYVLGMSHLIDLPPDEENSWNGTLYLDKFDLDEDTQYFNLTLDNDAAVRVRRQDGFVWNIGINTFQFRFLKSEKNTFEFNVKAERDKPFPNVESLVLNGVEICENATKFKPTIFGEFHTSSGRPMSGTKDPGPRCGLRKVSHKELIVDGHQSKAGDWPWHAGLYKYNTYKNTREYICGGSLLSNTIIVTAGHCVTENGRAVVPGRLLVGLGKHSLFGSDLGIQEITVFEVIVHPEFNASSLKNDIALLKLSVETTYTPYVQPICLWNTDVNPDIDIRNMIDVPGTVVGWGRWGFGVEETLSSQLQQGNMPVVSLTTCLSSYPEFFSLFLTDYTFCAGYKNGTSVCNGDSGGGMFFSKQEGDNLQWYIRGIVSLSVAKDDAAVCDPSHYVLFTDVAKYNKWIRSNLR